MESDVIPGFDLFFPKPLFLFKKNTLDIKTYSLIELQSCINLKMSFIYM